jgi:hypothetical protein
MRKIIVISIALIFMFSTAFAVGGKHHKRSSSIKGSWCVMDHMDVDIDKGTIILSHRDYKEPVVEITEEYELYINGRHIKTNDHQKELLEEYYETMLELIESAKAIGLKGARIGIDGAKLGLGALGSLFKLISPDYDMEDFEREIEAEAEEIEAKAELLEEEAEELEILADDLEDIYEEMEDEITELGELEW